VKQICVKKFGDGSVRFGKPWPGMNWQCPVLKSEPLGPTVTLNMHVKRKKNDF